MVGLREYKSGWSKMDNVAVRSSGVLRGFPAANLPTLTVAGLGKEQFPSFAMSVTTESPKICFTGCSDSF